MPIKVIPLNEALAYMYCPTCRDTLNNPKSPMKRDMHRVSCYLGHTFEYAQLQHMDVEMIKPDLIEDPPPHAVKVQVWVAPKTWELLQEKLKPRLWVTIGTLFDALLDNSLVLIQGEDAKELRKLGVKSGTEALAAIRSAKEMEIQLAEMQKRMDLIAPILQAAGL